MAALYVEILQGFSSDLPVYQWCANWLVVALQMNPAVSELSLYDVANTKGVAADCSHINSRAQVQVRWDSQPTARLVPRHHR